MLDISGNLITDVSHLSPCQTIEFNSGGNPILSTADMLKLVSEMKCKAVELPACTGGAPLQQCHDLESLTIESGLEILDWALKMPGMIKVTYLGKIPTDWNPP